MILQFFTKKKIFSSLTKNVISRFCRVKVIMFFGKRKWFCCFGGKYGFSENFDYATFARKLFLLTLKYDFWFEKLCNFVVLNLRNSFLNLTTVIFVYSMVCISGWLSFDGSFSVFEVFSYDLVLVSQKVVDKCKSVLFSRRSGPLELFCWLLSRWVCDSWMVLFGGCPYGCGDSFRLC